MRTGTTRGGLWTGGRVCAGILGACVLAAGASAQFAPSSTATLDPDFGSLAGIDVALGDGVAFVASPGNQFLNQDRAVHVYRENAGRWEVEQQLTSTTGQGNRFGWSIDYDGTSLIVGAPSLPGGDFGEAFVYTFDGTAWVEQELPEPPHAPNELIGFGSAVTISGSLAVVGAPSTPLVPIVARWVVSTDEWLMMAIQMNAPIDITCTAIESVSKKIMSSKKLK